MDTPNINEPKMKRHYLRKEGQKAPEGAKVFTTEESGKRYYLKEIGKNKGYVMED